MEMNKMKMYTYLGILGIVEMRWPELGDFWSGDYRIIQKTNETNKTIN